MSCSGLLCGVRPLLVPSSPIFASLKMEALRYSEISVLTRAKRRNISEVGILHSHRLQNLIS
jgi:hypothetical protein